MAFLRTVLAVILGLAVGSVVNMALVVAGGHVVAPPAGADLETVEGLRAAMPALRPAHFLFPFLAHALGTLVGAYVATRIAAHKRPAALAVTALFFCGGIMAAWMIPAPTWFIVADLSLAYFPFGWLGHVLGRPRGGAAKA
jgi:hypothetical protein